MRNYVLLATSVSAVLAVAFALCGRANAMMVVNPASVMAAVTAANFAQPERIRGFASHVS